MQLRLDHINVYRCRVELGFFGADSLKPVVIYCNFPWVTELVTYYCRNWVPGDTTMTTVTRAGNHGPESLAYLVA